MARYEVEVIGYFSEVIEVEADSYEEADSLALQDFESNNSPHSSRHNWLDSWTHTEIESSICLDEDEEN
jgi:hypothetical protein